MADAQQQQQMWTTPTRPDGTPYALPRDSVLTADECRRALGVGEEAFEAMGIPYVNMGRGEVKHRNRRYLWGQVLHHLFGSQAA